VGRTLWWLLIGTTLLLSVCAGGCVRQNVILVPPGEPVQIAEPVMVRVFVSTGGQRVKSDNQVELPAGWWALPDPEE